MLVYFVQNLGSILSFVVKIKIIYTLIYVILDSCAVSRKKSKSSKKKKKSPQYNLFQENKVKWVSLIPLW